MGFNTFRRRCNDSSDRIQAERKRKDGDPGRASKVLRMKRGITEHEVPPTAFELEAVPILPKESGVGQGVVKKRVTDAATLDEDRKTYPLTLDAVNGASET